MEGKTIKFLIEFEYSGFAGYSAVYKVTDMLFTEYDRLFKPEDILSAIKAVLKKEKSFTMITVEISVTNSNDYTTRPQIVRSGRYLGQGHGEKEYRYSRSADGRFGVEPDFLCDSDGEGWMKVDIKHLIQSIPDYVEEANRTYIQAVKAIGTAKVN